MENFIKSLSIEQLEILKTSVAMELDEKYASSKTYIAKSYEYWGIKELKKFKKKWIEQQMRVRNNSEFENIEIHVECIDEKLELLKS